MHRRYPVVDGHADSILTVIDGVRTLNERSEKGHLDFPRALEAGLACTVQAAWPGNEFASLLPREARSRFDSMHRDPHRRVAQEIDALRNQIDNAGGSVRLALTAADVRAAHAAGQLAVLINIEGAEAVEGDLALLRNFYRLGVRMMGLVWNFPNKVTDGAGDEGRGAGLTKFGRAVIREMNRLGMLIDLAHITPTGFFEVLELSTAPVLFTHGNCHALWQHARNLTDAQIKALAAKGGVMGISVVSTFMGPETATRKTVADHIDHVVQLLGSADHVAYGSDFDGCTPPPGLEDVTKLLDLTADLLDRGYTEADMAKILGGNYLRVFEEVLRP